MLHIATFSEAALAKTVERGTQTEFNSVESLVIPTSAYFSPGDECYHTSREYEALKSELMNATRRRRSCTHCVQRDGR